MSTLSTAPRRTGHRVRLVAAVVLVLLGLLGMHALSTHGMNTAPDPAPDPASATHAAHHDGSVTDPGRHDRHDGGSHHGHDGGAMLTMCLALLALLLLWPGRAHRVGHLLLPRATRSSAVLRGALRLDHGPPAAWEFSVIRC